MSNNFCMVSNCRYPKTHVTMGHQCGRCKKYGHGILECNNPIKIKNLHDKYKNDTLKVENYCTIYPCSHKHLHTTEAHQCGICNGNHSSDLHNILNQQVIEEINIKCPLCRKDNNLKLNQNKVKGCTDLCCICLTKPVEIFFPDCGHVCTCNDCFNKLILKDEKLDYEILQEADLNESIKNEAKRKFGKLSGKIFCKIYAGMGCNFYVRKDINENLEGFMMHQDNWGQYGPETDDRPKLNDFIKNYYSIN